MDPDTYEVRPRYALAVCDVGRAIHPTLCKGQIEGGTLQAVGFATIEEIKMEDGRYLNDRLATYLIPTIKDSPMIEVELLEKQFDGGPFGAKGIGELPMDGAAPAVVGAIENATGIAVDEIPATPERIFAAAKGRAPGDVLYVHRQRHRAHDRGGTDGAAARCAARAAAPHRHQRRVRRRGVRRLHGPPGRVPVLSCLVRSVSAKDVTCRRSRYRRSGTGFLDRFVDSGGVQCGACTPESSSRPGHC